MIAAVDWAGQRERFGKFLPENLEADRKPRTWPRGSGSMLVSLSRRSIDAPCREAVVGEGHASVLRLGRVL